MNFVKQDWFPRLLARITVGWVFLESGWGKLHHLPKVTEFFRSLGIPAPQLMAPFVASIELLGGALLLAGIATRVVTLPLIATMLVALATAKRDDISSLSDLFSNSEYLYIVIMLWLALAGPGSATLVRWLPRGWQRGSGR